MRHSVAKAELFVTQGFTWGDTGSGRRQNQAPGGRKGSSNNEKWIYSHSTIAHALHGLPNHPGALATQASLCRVCKRGAV